MKRIIIFLGIILLIVFTLPILTYLLHFYSCSLSDNTEAWAHFGGYLNGVLTPIIAIVGLMITITIAFYTEQNNKLNIQKQEMQERPLVYITYGDYELNLELNIVNKGLGPLIVKDFYIINKINKDKKSSIFDWITDVPGHYDNYTNNQNGLVLSPNEKLNLFKLSDKQEDFEERKLEIRKLFKDLRIVIIYSDVYDKNMPEYSRDLEWFGRNLD
jgi:hypothetical protein